MLPRPQVVVVQDFAVAPGEVQLDPGLSGTIDETLGGKKLPPQTAKEQQVGRQVADALAEKLVVEIRDLGLPAERGRACPPGTSTGLVVSGQFVSVDQGNRTERVTIGLGAGRSDVRVRAQVFDVTPQAAGSPTRSRSTPRAGCSPAWPRRWVRAPWPAISSTSTLISGGLQVADEFLGTSVVADADRAAKGIAKQLASFFAQQGWTQ